MPILQSKAGNVIAQTLYIIW